MEARKGITEPVEPEKGLHLLPGCIYGQAEMQGWRWRSLLQVHLSSYHHRLLCSVIPASPYICKYKVLHRCDTTYTTKIHNILTTVSANCLKLAYIIHPDIEDLPPPATLSGTMNRSIRWGHSSYYLKMQQSQCRERWWRCGERH